MFTVNSVSTSNQQMAPTRRMKSRRAAHLQRYGWINASFEGPVLTKRPRAYENRRTGRAQTRTAAAARDHRNGEEQRQFDRDEHNRSG